MIKIKKYTSFIIALSLITAYTVLGADNISGNNSSIKTKATIKNSKEHSEKNETIDTDNITFDFPNTKLVVFARFVAKLCVKTLIGEELLKGNITIKSQKKMNLQQVKEVFRLLLNSKGHEYTETNVYMKIIPISDSIVKVYSIKYLKSADITKALTQIFRMSFREGNKPTTIQISSNDATNSVIVLAPKSQQIEIEKSIKELDTMVKEVLLNIKVVELTRNKIFGYGFGLTYSPSSGDVAKGGITSSNSPFYPINGSSSLEKFTTVATPAAVGFQNHGTLHINVQGVDNKTNIKVLSQPRIIAKANKKATLKIGEKQNYISGSSSLGGSTPSVTGTTQTTASNEVGINIEITPRINKIKNVILELKMTITSVQGDYDFDSNGSISKIPIIGSRVINNTSSVMNGETLIIGGLLKNEKTTTTIMPPVLGDIPLVGWLFSQQNEIAQQVELMVFITPTVIDSIESNNIALKNEVNKLREYDPKNKAIIDQMLTGKKSKTDDVFNVFDYFSDGNYRKDQHFIQQPENL